MRKQDQLIFAIDGGGTSCRAVLSRANGERLAEGRARTLHGLPRNRAGATRHHRQRGRARRSRHGLQPGRPRASTGDAQLPELRHRARPNGPRRGRRRASAAGGKIND